MFSKEYLSTFKSLDLTDNINMAGYCAANTALHFSSELLYLTGYMPKGSKISYSLQDNSLSYGQKLAVSTLECYNTYQKLHGNVKERATTKSDQVLPYFADALAALVSIGTNYNPLFVVGNIVMADVTSKSILNATPENIKTNYIDPVLEHLGFAGSISGDHNKYGFVDNID
jgi:hypothetical protein